MKQTKGGFAGVGRAVPLRNHGHTICATMKNEVMMEVK